MKRVIALLLALIMMLSMAVPAIADGQPGGDGMTVDPVDPADVPDGGQPDIDPGSVPGGVPGDDIPPETDVTETVPPVPEGEATPEPDEETPSEPTASPEPSPEESPEPTPEETPEPSPDPDAGIMLMAVGPPASTGQLDLSIETAVELGAWMPVFTVSLGVAGGTQHNIEIPVGGSHSFLDLAQGTYTLTVTAPGFARFTQDFEIGKCEGLSVRLQIGRRMGYGDKHPGVLLMGDADGNGLLDDSAVIMQAVDASAPAEAGLSAGYGYTDLNADGVTTLADAEIYARNAALSFQPEAVRATSERYIPQTAIQPGYASDVTAEGLESVLLGDGVKATLERRDGGEITPQTPVDVVFNLGDGAQPEMMVVEGSNIDTGDVEITYLDEAGNEVTAWGHIDPAGVSGISLLSLEGVPTVAVSRDASGNIVVGLGGQVAVKKVSLKITGTKGENKSLAEITQVEFLNGMEDRIIEPETDIPEGLDAAAGSKEFTVTWGNNCANITGYEVMVSLGELSETIPVTGRSLTVTRFNGDELRNYTEYAVYVRSVNGNWSSDWAGPKYVTPMPTGKPDKPDNVKAEGGFESVTVSWKDMKDTQSYNVYYKEESAEAYAQITGLMGTSYKITGLDSTKPTTYVVYVTGVNGFGESDPSLAASAVTVTLDPPDMPKFNLINQSGNVPGSTHIVSVSCNAGASRFNSDVDPEAGTAWCTVDGVPASYYSRTTWDDGGFNWLGQNIGLTYTFDAVYTMDTIAFMPPVGMSCGYAKVRWWDADGTEHLTDQGVVAVQSRTDAQGRGYYFLRLPGPVTTNKIQIGLSRGWVLPNEVSVAEVYFYKYDSLKEELMSLYVDDLHTMLRDDVNEQMLDDLEARINASVDEFNNVNPDRDMLLKELETARQILAEMKLSRITRIHDGITESGDGHGFGGLNAWQPLGVVAAEGDTVVVYVGHSYKTAGSSTSLNLIATQYHAESSALAVLAKKNLQVGRNEITIPQISSTTGVESGGALYIEYTGGAGAGESYAVRVSGGVQVPVLDLYKVTDQGEKLNRVASYLEELTAFTEGIEGLHAEHHQGENANAKVNYAYDEMNCILGSSDIMMDTMMLSIPAQQIVAGCGGDPQTLLNSLNAMENMMYLFYQHKGLNANAAAAVDRIPNRHLNIRYMRMFSGAFMYASGNHIGIEWPETKGMASCAGVTADANGLYQGGNYFGWGIAHEIGHDINQDIYAIAEVTNNYFAVLAQAQDTNESVRFQYPEVYKKVTSGTKGSASNVFTQLGMYWQLHLAYDMGGYNFKTYADHAEQLANIFFARVDTYARTPGSAPKPGGVALTLEGADREQALMRLCCAAAQRDILDFFRRWGKTPDETTIAYAAQFTPETRAIYYICDDARRYAMENPGASKLGTEGTVDAIDAVTVVVDPASANQVNITVTPNSALRENEILGYEIVRCTISGGAVEKKTVGFTTENTFSDVVSVMNNRTVSYEITLVDKYLNRSLAEVTDMVKIQHEGDLDKSHWTVSTAGLTAEPIQITGTEDDPDAYSRDPAVGDPAVYIADGSSDTIYKAVVGGDAAIEIDFHETNVITGFRYRAGTEGAIDGYAVSICQNGEWSQIDSGTLGGDKTVYFSNADGKYVSTHSAEAMRLTLTGQAGGTITVAELDVLGPSGDNVDFQQADGSPAIGYMAADYVYDQAKGLKIPEGALVFTGSYKGNAGYNVVLLYDQDGSMVTGFDASDESLVADQIILAPDPGEGKIENTANGIWVYWIEKQYLENFTMPTKVRAELYRVNDHATNEGERLVSDTLFVDVPSELGKITLSAVG